MVIQAFRIIIRDDKGQVLLFASKWLPVLYDILVGKALAILSGLQLALKVGFDNLIVESDNI